MHDQDYEERGPLQRYGFPIGIGAVILIVAVLVIGHHSTGDNSPAPRHPDIVMVHPVLPPPPPPPVTPPPEAHRQVVDKMIEQTPLDHPEDKPDPPKEASAPISTNVTGPGSDAFGLSGGKGGMGGAGGGGGGSHSRFGWYATQVQRAILAALTHNPVTGSAEFTDRVKVWADATGRVTQIKLERTTGSAAVDQAIADALGGLQLQEPPPADMPMPILMRIVARRHS